MTNTTTTSWNRSKEFTVPLPWYGNVLVRDEKTVNKHDLSSLRRFSSSAAPLSDEILKLQ